MTDFNMEIILNAWGYMHVQGQTAEKCFHPQRKMHGLLHIWLGKENVKAEYVHENQTVSCDIEHSMQALFEAGDVRSG